MDERITGRLAQLRADFEQGQARLAQLEVEQAYLRERLLMLKGAIGVLEDLLPGAADGGTGPAGGNHSSGSGTSSADQGKAASGPAPDLPNGTSGSGE